MGARIHQAPSDRRPPSSWQSPLGKGFHYAPRIWDGVKKVPGPLRIQPPSALTPGLICFCIKRPRLFKNQAS